VRITIFLAAESEVFASATSQAQHPKRNIPSATSQAQHPKRNIQGTLENPKIVF
jgi:hypothetical protein